MTKYYAAAIAVFFITPAAFAAPAVADTVAACCAALDAGAIALGACSPQCAIARTSRINKNTRLAAMHEC